MDTWVVISLGLSLAIIFIFAASLYFLLRRLNSSIAKLGFVIREDAKKYFDDASGKVVETNEQFGAMYTKIVEQGTKQALADTTKLSEATLARAHENANSIILSAQSESQRILQSAKEDAASRHQKALDQSTATIQWALEQYALKSFSVETQHELIKKLIEDYTNEHRS